MGSLSLSAQSANFASALVSINHLDHTHGADTKHRGFGRLSYQCCLSEVQAIYAWLSLWFLFIRRRQDKTICLRLEKKGRRGCGGMMEKEGDLGSRFNTLQVN